MSTPSETKTEVGWVGLRPSLHLTLRGSNAEGEDNNDNDNDDYKGRSKAKRKRSRLQISNEMLLDPCHLINSAVAFYGILC